eukprot:365122-Chlamydomonas_euryale.AAC.39
MHCNPPTPAADRAGAQPPLQTASRAPAPLLVHRSQLQHTAASTPAPVHTLRRHAGCSAVPQRRLLHLVPLPCRFQRAAPRRHRRTPRPSAGGPSRSAADAGGLEGAIPERSEGCGWTSLSFSGGKLTCNSSADGSRGGLAGGSRPTGISASCASCTSVVRPMPTEAVHGARRFGPPNRTGVRDYSAARMKRRAEGVAATWSQTADEVLVRVPVEEGVRGRNIGFEVHPKRLVLSLDGKPLLAGDFDGTNSVNADGADAYVHACIISGQEVK